MLQRTPRHHWEELVEWDQVEIHKEWVATYVMDDMEMSDIVQEETALPSEHGSKQR